MGSRLRARATRLIGQLDAERGYREQIERDIARRVGTEPTAQAAPSVTSVAAPDAQTCRSCGSRSRSTTGSANTAAPAWSQGDEARAWALGSGRCWLLRGSSAMGLVWRRSTCRIRPSFTGEPFRRRNFQPGR